MPIRTYLEGHRFDDETTRLMGIAFEMAVVVLQHTEGTVSPTRQTVAKKIIELAKAGERHPGRLCDAALQALRASSEVKVSDCNPLPPPAPPPEHPDN
jgi:hypothetical protein